MYFASSYFNFKPNPTFGTGFGLVCGGWTTAGTSILVDKIALNGSGVTQGVSLPTGTGGLWAGSAGNSTIGLYMGGGYNNTATVTNINQGRSYNQIVTYATQAWTPSSSYNSQQMFCAASMCNSTDGYLLGGISGLVQTPQSLGYQYNYAASSVAATTTKVTAIWAGGASGPTQGIAVGGETAYPSSGYTQTYTNTCVLFTYATQAGTNPTALFTTAMAGSYGAGNATSAFFYGGTYSAGGPQHNGSLYNWAGQTHTSFTGSSSYNTWGQATFSSTSNAWFCYLATSPQLNTTLSSMTLLANANQLVYNFTAATLIAGTALTTVRSGPTGMSSNPGWQ